MSRPLSVAALQARWRAVTAPAQRPRLRRTLRGAAPPALAAALLIGLGLAARAGDLTRPALSPDEAESAINALTILSHGVPTDRYQGLPLYENTLTRPWPESEEYAFRDTSYSSRGLAVYHGWLPLYAIAGSFALAGVEPAPTPAAGQRGPLPPLDMEQVLRQTRAARLPALAFSALFLVALLLGGRLLLGGDAGWVALAVGALAEPCVRSGRQARYYAATLALTTVCCLAVWRVRRRGRRRDWALAALAFVLLFHTHVLSFAAGCAVAASWLGPLLVRASAERAAARRGAALFLALVAAGTVPWALATGFFEPLPYVVPARDTLTLLDPLRYLAEHPELSGLMLAGLVWLGAAPLLLRARRLPERWTAPYRRSLAPVGLLLLWVVTGYAAFPLLVPAASCFFWRASLAVQGPAILLGAVLLTAAARAALGGAQRARWLALPLALLLLTAQVDRLTQLVRPGPRPGEPVLEAAAYLRGLDLTSGARVYATPSEHLPLTLYSGIPVQSVAPVRASFLDRYPGEVVVVEAFARPRRPAPRRDPHWQNPAMFRGHEAYTQEAFWQVFFYRFARPEPRSSVPCYAGRIAGSRPHVLPSTWLVYRCPPQADPMGPAGGPAVGAADERISHPTSEGEER